ncbi:hypothetical protein GCM10007387_57760 [Pseudoduganella albidiflava]|nr:hypothetical protein GCM10007387_57760 [Pseudoduganella albidiflava]
MAKNYVGEGEILDVNTGGTAVVGGTVVVMGKRIGVALRDIAANSNGVAAVEGVFNLAKLAGDAVAQGDLLYWDAANARLTVTAAGNTLAGYATGAAAAGVTTVNVKINA